MKRKMYLRKNIFNISIFAFLLQAGGEEGKEKKPKPVDSVFSSNILESLSLIVAESLQARSGI